MFDRLLVGTITGQLILEFRRMGLISKKLTKKDHAFVKGMAEAGADFFKAIALKREGATDTMARDEPDQAR